MNGKHLYYRCTDRVLSFPFPRTCKEKGINARIADSMVWEKVSEMMSSPELLLQQAERWFRSQQEKAKTASGDVSILKREIEKLKKQEKRYGKAYGAGVLTLEQLKEYTGSVRERITELEVQITAAQGEAEDKPVHEMPSREEIEAFTEKAKTALQNLTFQAKRAIVLNTIEKVIGTKDHLQVFGYIPITQNVEFKTDHRYRQDPKGHGFNFEIENVEFKTSDRHRQNTKRHYYAVEDLKLVPFAFDIDLPATQRL